jgi:uncharacterized membrane protein
VKLKWLIIGLACFLYVGFRLWNLTASCLWFDEIFSVHAAEHTWTGLLNFAALDLIHPPLFYAALKIWMLIGGDSVFWLRLFPVVMASATLLPLILLCGELKFSTYETVAVILLLAVNGSLIKYAQEVRMYSMLFFLATMSIWLFMRWNLRAEKTLLLWLFVVNLLLIYTHYFGWLVVLTEVVAALAFKRDVKNWFLMTGVWILAFVPWTYAVFSAYKTNGGLEQNLNWADKPGIAAVLQFVATLHQPFYFQQTSADPAFSLFGIPVIIVSVTAVVCLFIFEKNLRTEVRTLLAFTAIPLAIAFLASWLTPFSVWGTRHLMVVFAPYLLLVVMGIKYMTPRTTQNICYAIFAVMAVPALVIMLIKPEPMYSWCGWNRLAQEIKDSDVTTVYTFEDAAAYEMWFASQRETGGKLKVVLIEDDPDIPEDKAYFLPRGFDEVKKINESDIEGDKFWIAARSIWDDKDLPLWQKLKDRGYETDPPFRLRVKDGTKYPFDFMIPVRREENK